MRTDFFGGLHHPAVCQEAPAQESQREPTGGARIKRRVEAASDAGPIVRDGTAVQLRFVHASVSLSSGFRRLAG